MTSILYADEIKSVNDSKVVNLNGVKIGADDVQAGYTIRATGPTQASWVNFQAIASPAPVDAEYITLTSNATLTAEKTFVVGTGISTTDNGAGSTYEIDTTSISVKTGTFYNPTLTTDTTGRISDVEHGRCIVLPVKATGFTGTLSSLASGSVVDGVVMSVGDRVLIKDETNLVNNGIYEVASSGPPLRSRDFENLGSFSSEIAGYIISVEDGTFNKGNVYICKNVAGTTIGVDDIRFEILGGISSRLKAVSWDDINSIDINTSNRTSTLGGAHYDIQTATSTFLIPATTTLDASFNGLSIDGKMSGMTYPDTGTAIVFQNKNFLQLKNLNITKSVATGNLISLNGCNDMIISDCIFNYNTQCLILNGCSRVIIKNCIFIATASSNQEAISIINGGQIIITGCEFRNIVITDNSSNACITTNVPIIATNNTFINTGRLMSFTADYSIATYNNNTLPSNNPAGTGTPVINLSGVAFGYINVSADLSVINNNSFSFPNSITANNAVVAVLVSSGSLSNTINGNILRLSNISPTGSRQCGMIGLEATGDNVIVDNTSVIDTPFSNGTDRRQAFIGVGTNCNSAIIANNNHLYAQVNPSSGVFYPFAYSISTSANSYVRVVRGSVAIQLSSTILFPTPIPASDNFDYFEFRPFDASTYTFTMNSVMPIGSSGYRTVLRRNNTLTGSTGQVDINISTLTTGTGISFPASSTSSAVIQWNGFSWDTISLQGGASVIP